MLNGIHIRKVAGYGDDFLLVVLQQVFYLVRLGIFQTR